MPSIPNKPGHIRLIEGRKNVFLPLSAITRIEGINKCIRLHQTVGKPYLTSLTMKVLLVRYPGQFLRIDPSHAVRLTDIMRVDMKRRRVELVGGTVLPMAVTYKDEVWEAWQGHIIRQEA